MYKFKYLNSVLIIIFILSFICSFFVPEYIASNINKTINVDKHLIYGKNKNEPWLLV